MSDDSESERTVSNDAAVRRFLHENRDSMIEQLAAWVRIPSDAALPEREMDVARSGHWLAAAFRSMGLTTELLPTGETVAVFAELHVDDALPTVLVYSHHDVRHAKAEEWAESHPFEPVLREGRLHGRGASDAKGQVIAHLWGLKAHLASSAAGTAAVNLKFFVDGEEELGSPHLADLISEQKAKLSCDTIVYSDTIQWKEGDPAVVTSIRGMVGAKLQVVGPERDVHSGAVSGAAPNPVHVLVDVLSRLHDEAGRITLPGFYDDVDDLTPERAAELEKLPFDEKAWIDRTETRAIRGEEGFSVPERLWCRPSLEILSLVAGDPDGIPRAVIPSEAGAELSIRTVPSQTVATVASQLRAFFARNMPDSVHYTLQVDETTAEEPLSTPDGPELSALERASARAHGTASAGRMGNAGGGPAELLARTLQAPVLFVGTGLPEDHWHASDESVDIEMLLSGAATICHLWSELGELAEKRRSPDEPLASGGLTGTSLPQA